MLPLPPGASGPRGVAEQPSVYPALSLRLRGDLEVLGVQEQVAVALSVIQWEKESRGFIESAAGLVGCAR